MTATQILVAIADVLAAVVLLALSVPFGKGSFLPTGSDTASKTEKSRWDEPALCRTMARTLRMAVIGPVLWAIATLIGSKLLNLIGLGMFVGVIAGGLFYAARHHRVRQ